jgi:alpha-tubulin suppressor-like RCC1 family protein
MKKMMQYCSLVMAGLLMSALLTACGSGTSTTVFSSATPAIFYAHSVVFRNSTTLVAWGNNSFGQLGDNSSTSRLVPVVVTKTNLAGARLAGVSVGGTHTLAFKNLSGAFAWGNNGFGQLGNNTAAASTTPVPVLQSVGTGTTTSTTNLLNVIAVAAGGNHSLALVQDRPGNTVWAWGSNVFGQLGDKTTTSRLAAVQVQDPVNGDLTPLAGVTKIAAGGSHSLALRTNGQVSSWGYNGFGQLGQRIRFQNLSTLNRPFPDQVLKADDSTLSGVTHIAAGGSHSLAIVNEGPDPTNPATASVWAWGYNFLGQLGDGKTIDQPKAVQVKKADGNPLDNVVAIAAGLDHSLALVQDKDSPGKFSVWAWGFNFFGQLGNGDKLGSNDAVTKPVQVKMSDGNPLILTGAVTIVAIGNHSLAIAVNDAVNPRTTTVWAWGDNTFGQLGNNTNTNSEFAKVTGF